MICPIIRDLCLNFASKPLISDSFHRIHNYLRISLTDNCNLRCFYCMPEEDIVCASREQLMQPSEIETLARTFVEMGVNKIRLTGGEPLVRKEFDDILTRLSKLPVQLLLTTNGILINRHLTTLKKSGIRSVNISLDTLNPDTFFKITRRNSFNEVMNNLHLLLAEGFHVKINMVVMKGVNEREINDFVRWSIKEPVHVRFIEFMPFTGNHWQQEKVFTEQEILHSIAAHHNFIPLLKEPHATANKFFVKEAKGSFAIISTMSHPFCGDCNRLRLTADGKLKNCLFSTSETDLLTPLRNQLPLEALIYENIAQKKEKLGGQWEQGFEYLNAEELTNRSMINIGG